MPLELHDLNWDWGFGHVQTTLNPWSQPQWVPRLVDAIRADPEAAIPGAVGTAETCFRKPDGWIACVFRDSIWAQQYRDKGFPEVLENAPEFIPPVAASVPIPAPPVVVPSNPEIGVPENEEVLHGEGGLLDWGVGVWQDWNRASPLTIPYGNPVSAPPQYTSSTPVTANGACGCNRSPCVCGTINGRAALVDPVTGKRCYKRRRPKLLTDGDFNSLMRIATLPNNQNVRIALAKAIGRR